MLPLNRRVFPLASTRIPQPRCNPVDADVDAALYPFVGQASAVAADQLDLQVVQWVDVGEAVADRPVERRVAGQAVFLACDLRERVGRAVPFGFDGRKNLLAQAGVAHQF